MAENLPSPSVLLADRSYDGGSNRAKLTARNVLHVIPMRTSRKKRIGVDRLPYCLRNLVECCFNKLKNARRVATRRDNTIESFPDFTGIRLCLRLFQHNLAILDN
jgi:transposase